MGVHDGPQVGAQLVDVAVDGELHAGLVQADHRAVGLDLHDVRAGQAALVDAGGGDPDVAVFVANGKVAAGGGGHAVGIDAVHDHHQLVCRVQKLKIHSSTSSNIHSVCFDYQRGLLNGRCFFCNIHLYYNECSGFWQAPGIEKRASQCYNKRRNTWAGLPAEEEA